MSDAEVFSDYLNRIPKFVAKHQGKYWVKGAKSSCIEGDWCPETVVLIEFPSHSNLQAFTADSAVKKRFSLRQQSTVSRLIAVSACE